MPSLFQIIHAATGLVKSNPVLTTFQVLSRVWVVVCVLLATPYSYAASSFGLPLAILAWSITEIIRYAYYFMNLNDFIPYALTWLRYITYKFMILYISTNALRCLIFQGPIFQLLQIYAIYYTISNRYKW